MAGQRIVRRALEQAWMRVEIEGERGVEEVTCLAVRGCRGGGHSEERQGRGGEEAAPAQPRAVTLRVGQGEKPRPVVEAARAAHMEYFTAKKAREAYWECGRQRGERPSTRFPYSSTVAVQPGCTSVLASGSSMIAGPARTLPRRSLPRSKTRVD